MAPLGVLTIMVGAIRVAGPSFLRNLIGKAREPTGVAESEFLSSTSEDVCEIWDKRGVVRQVGSAKIRQVIFDDTPGSQDVWSMWDAEFNGTASADGPYITRENKDDNATTDEEDLELKRKWDGFPPNLTLNAHAQIDGRFEIMLYAIIGVILQLGVLVFQGLVTYQWRWETSENLIADYAFPLASAGLVMVCTGVVICARIIEALTKEVRWIPAERTKREKKHFQVLWIQQADQRVPDGYAIYRDEHNTRDPTLMRPIWGSYRLETLRLSVKNKLLVTVGTSLCFVGFPLQLIGLRGLHYSATMAQLTATVIMTILRSVARRGLTPSCKVEPLERGYELDRVALKISGLQSYRPGPRFPYWKDIDRIPHPRGHPLTFRWTDISSQRRKPCSRDSIQAWKDYPMGNWTQ